MSYREYLIPAIVMVILKCFALTNTAPCRTVYDAKRQSLHSAG